MRLNWDSWGEAVAGLMRSAIDDKLRRAAPG
jgi:hypothetical protein